MIFLSTRQTQARKIQRIRSTIRMKLYKLNHNHIFAQPHFVQEAQPHFVKEAQPYFRRLRFVKQLQTVHTRI